MIQGIAALPVEAPALRVALLVDGDNISQDRADQILQRSLTQGALLIRRVYCDVTRNPKWVTAPGFRLVHAGSGKNSTDVLLAIEAVSLSRDERIDTFVLASSDQDFSHLAYHLKERGHRVVGIGESKTSEPFRRACTVFLQLPDVKAEATSPAASVPVAKSLEQHLIDHLRTAPAKGIALTSLNPVMQRLGFKISETVELHWRAYLAARPKLFECDPKGPTAFVRLRRG